jgi:hypothetical protein
MFLITIIKSTLDGTDLVMALLSISGTTGIAI